MTANNSSRSKKHKLNLRLSVPLLVIVLTWAALYLPHLRTSPAWYGDETGTFLLGRNLIEGSPTLGSVWLTYCHTYYPIQPGYLAAAGLFSKITGGDILGARFLNTLIALSIACIIFLFGRKRFGILSALFGAGMFLTYNQTVIHYRWVYPHNAVSLFFVLTLFFLLKRSQPRTDWKAGIALGLSVLCHPLAVHGAFSAFLCRLFRPKAWFRLAIPPALALSLTFTLAILYYWPKPWFIEDITNLATYYAKSSAEGGGQSNLLLNFLAFYTQDIFHIASLLCLILCCRRKAYPIAIFGFTVSCLLLQNRQNLPLFYYQAIVLVPIFGVAWAATLSLIGRKLRRLIRDKRFDRLTYRAALAVPVIFALTLLPTVLQGNLISRNHNWVTQNVPEVEAAAQWLNENTTPEDLVIANVNISWLLKARTADYFQVVLWNGLTTEYFKEGFKRERFRYPTDLDSAKYVVVGDIDQRWTLAQPNMAETFDRVATEKWPIVWQGPNYIIVGNPRLAPADQADGEKPTGGQ